MFKILVIDFIEKSGRVSFQVYVVPRASCSEIAGERNGSLRVRIAAPPVDGAANRELIGFLASLLGVPRTAVEIAAGQSAKTKRIVVSGCNRDRFISIVKALECIR